MRSFESVISPEIWEFNVYNKETDFTDVMDQWGNGATWNSDIIGNNGSDRFWITKKLDLYAKWRAKIVGANGIGVIYDLNGGTGDVTDSNLYLDQAHATAQQAPAAPENQKFVRWVIQTWDKDYDNGDSTPGAYVDTSFSVYPGDTFEVLKSRARQIVTEYEADNVTPKTATYTVQLRADYITTGTAVPTEIHWYGNNETTTDGGASFVVTDSNVLINDAVNVRPADTFSYEGHRFVGWARVPVTDDAGSELDPALASRLSGQSLTLEELGEDDLFLQYNEAEGTFTATGETTGASAGTTVTKVAPDERYPKHAMVAVWERIYKLTVRKNVVSDIPADLAADFTFSPARKNEGSAAYTSGPAFTLQHSGSLDVYDDLAKNTRVRVTETENQEFEISVSGKYTDDAGAEHPYSAGSLSNGSEITVLGDTEITVTNKRKTKKVRIYKVDDSEPAVPLEHVGFTLNGETLTTGADGYTAVQTLSISGTPYTLTESEPIDHYTGLASPVPVTVSDSGVTVPAGTDHVSVAGPDASGVFTITVVNPRELYTVTVVKNAAGLNADKDASYSFTASGLSTDSFTLFGQEKKEGETITQTNSAVFSGIPYGSFISVSEDDSYTAFDTGIVIEKSFGGTSDRTELESPVLSTGNVTVTGDVTITYTNTRNRQLVSVWKTDADHTALTDAGFVLYRAADYDDTAGMAKSNAEAVASGTVGGDGILALGSLEVGEYRLVETIAPAGYYPAESAIIIVVESGRVTAMQSSASSEVAQKGGQYWVSGQPDETWQIRVWNNPGYALPSTGGSGTVWCYALGTLMVLAAGLFLKFRNTI